MKLIHRFHRFNRAVSASLSLTLAWASAGPLAAPALAQSLGTGGGSAPRSGSVQIQSGSAGSLGSASGLPLANSFPGFVSALNITSPGTIRLPGGGRTALPVRVTAQGGLPKGIIPAASLVTGSSARSGPAIQRSGSSPSLSSESRRDPSTRKGIASRAAKAVSQSAAPPSRSRVKTAGEETPSAQRQLGGLFDAQEFRSQDPEAKELRDTPSLGSLSDRGAAVAPGASWARGGVPVPLRLGPGSLNASPRPGGEGPRGGMSWAELFRGLGGSLVSLVPLPVPATLVVLFQSPRLYYWGARRLWGDAGKGMPEKLALSSLYLLAYIPALALTLPAATLGALIIGFQTGKTEGVGTAFSDAWKDVWELNRWINYVVKEIKGEKEETRGSREPTALNAHERGRAGWYGGLVFAKNIPTQHRTVLRQAFQRQSSRLARFLARTGLNWEAWPLQLRVVSSQDHSPGVAAVVRSVSYVVEVVSHGTALRGFSAEIDLKTGRLSLYRLWKHLGSQPEAPRPGRGSKAYLPGLVRLELNPRALSEWGAHEKGVREFAAAIGTRYVEGSFSRTDDTRIVAYVRVRKGREESAAADLRAAHPMQILVAAPVIARRLMAPPALGEPSESRVSDEFLVGARKQGLAEPLLGLNDPRLGQPESLVAENWVKRTYADVEISIYRYEVGGKTVQLYARSQEGAELIMTFEAGRQGGRRAESILKDKDGNVRKTVEERSSPGSAFSRLLPFPTEKIDPILGRQLAALKDGEIAVAIVSFHIPLTGYPPTMPEKERRQKLEELYRMVSADARSYLIDQGAQINELKNIWIVVARVTREQAYALAAMPSVKGLTANQEVELIQ